MDWKNIVNLASLPMTYEDWGPRYKGHTSPRFAKDMGARKLGFHTESIPPGMFTCPYHWHHGDEELFLVLKGKAMLRQNGAFREVVAGDLIHFSNAPEGAHQFYNHTDEPFDFLALSTNEPFDVCEYPDSGKVLVRPLRKLYDKDAAVDYLKGEADPRSFWPEEILRRGPGARED